MRKGVYSSQGAYIRLEDDGEYHVVDGQLHCSDGPAILSADGTLQWWINGERHRADGPAIIWPSGYVRWYWKGTNLVIDEWMQLSNISNLEKIALYLRYG